MEISQKVAYLKGLAEGLALDTESKEGKLIAAIMPLRATFGFSTNLRSASQGRAGLTMQFREFDLAN